MKIRIFKNNDTTIFSYPSDEYQRKSNFEGCKFPDFTEGLEYIDVDESDLPVLDSTTGDYHEMIHFDGDCHIDNLKQDKNWSKVLMPTFLVKQKQNKYIDSQIDAELSADIKDPIRIISLQREKEELADLTDKEVYELALSNLSRSEKDTTVIAQKLTEKIAELSAIKG